MGCGASSQPPPEPTGSTGPVDREALVREIFAQCDKDKSSTLDKAECKRLANKVRHGRV